MSRAIDLIQQLEILKGKKKGMSKKDPGDKKATDQVSKLQKFDFDYIDGRKKYKKLNG